jgi:hypothetical protein
VLGVSGCRADEQRGSVQRRRRGCVFHSLVQFYSFQSHACFAVLLYMFVFTKLPIVKYYRAKATAARRRAVSSAPHASPPALRRPQALRLHRRAPRRHAPTAPTTLPAAHKSSLGARLLALQVARRTAPFPPGDKWGSQICRRTRPRSRWRSRTLGLQRRLRPALVCQAVVPARSRATGCGAGMEPT